MRQLWHIGWMHNRVRMITASFLVKHLLVSWVDGERWFWDTLVDGDLAVNAQSWQWVAGSGTDSQPFFRVFNPVTQGEKFDPDGAYVRRWVPELAQLPRPLHPRAVGRAGGGPGAGGRGAGRDYPRPVVALDRGAGPRAGRVPRDADGGVIPPGQPLRVVGDVHGDARAFAFAAETDRFVVQLGDLTDSGPDSAGALDMALRLVDEGRGVFLLGNHDRKLGRALGGQPVRIDPALEETLAQLPPRLRERALEAIGRAPAWIVRRRAGVRAWRLPHRDAGAAPPPGLGRVDTALSRALFGQTTGRMQTDGYPERVLRWVDRIPDGVTVYCGHDRRSTDGRPYVRVGSGGGTAVFLDTGRRQGRPPVLDRPAPLLSAPFNAWVRRAMLGAWITHSPSATAPPSRSPPSWPLSRPRPRCGWRCWPADAAASSTSSRWTTLSSPTTSWCSPGPPASSWTRRAWTCSPAPSWTTPTS